MTDTLSIEFFSDFDSVAQGGTLRRNADGETTRMSLGTEPLGDTDACEKARLRLELIRFTLDYVSDAAFLMDQGRFIYVNEEACRSLGYHQDELLTMAISDVDPGLTHERLQEIRRVLKAEGRHAMESRHLRKDGTEFPVEVRTSTFIHDGQLMSLALARDIAERKKGADALHRLNRALKTLSAGNECLVRATTEDELLDRMCRIMVDVGGYQMAWIGFEGCDGDTRIRAIAWSGIDDNRHQECSSPGYAHAAVRTMERREPIIVRDTGSDPAHDAYREDALRAGFRSNIVIPLLDEEGPFGTLSIYSSDPNAFDTAEEALLRELAEDLIFGIRVFRSLEDRERGLLRVQQAMESTIQALASTLELRDPYTAGHQRRVARLAAAIARRMELEPSLVEGLYLAGIIHDVGKIYVPSEVLTRPGRLTAVEYSLVQAHVEAGYGILKPIDFPWPIAEIVRQHHERMDGSGYPLGVKGDAIRIEARIMAVADVVEAMSSHRPYRAGLGIDAALAEIDQGRGRLFDSAVVAACITLFRNDGFQFE